MPIPPAPIGRQKAGIEIDEEGDQKMHEAGLARGRLDAQHRMHHDNHDDADAFGVVYPVDAYRR